MKIIRFCAALALVVAASMGTRLFAQSAAPVPAPGNASTFQQTLTKVPPAAAKPTTGPMIDFDNISFSFGKILVGEKVRHTYVVTNTGTETLVITNVHPGCHCTAIGDWTHTIEPGQTGGITIQFDSTGFNGPISRHIDVYCNAVNGPSMRMLTLGGTITKAIDISPSSPMISISADATNAVSTTVRLVNQMDKPVTLTKVLSVNSNFVTELKELKAGKEYELTITVNPPFPQNTVSGLIKVDTSDPTIGSVTLNALARVEPAVQVLPPQIFFSGAPDQWTTNRINIRGVTARPLQLTNLTASDPGMTLNLKPGNQPNAYLLEVGFPPGFQTEPGKRAEVTMNTSEPHEPTIRIPVMVYPQRARPGATYNAQRPVPVINSNALAHANPPRPLPVVNTNATPKPASAQP